MGRYVIDLDLDGYEDDDEREAAEIAFIKEQLDFSASSVRVVKVIKKGDSDT